MLFSRAFQLKLSSTDTPSFMVALYPNKPTRHAILDLIDELDLEDAETIKKKELHCTLRYWKAEQYNDKHPIKDFLKELNPLTSNIKTSSKEFKILGDDNSLVVVLEKTSELIDIQKLIDSKLQEVGVPKSDFPEFLPHITVAQGVKEIPDYDLNLDIELSRLRFVNNEDKIYWETVLE